MTKLGQYFLRNRSITEKIVRAVDPRAQEIIIEIGPGHGELTRELVAQKKQAQKIIAIEKDHGLLARLVSQSELADVEFIHGDALEITPQLIRESGIMNNELRRSDSTSIIHNSKFIIHSYKIVGNIPYYISGRLFRMLGTLQEKPARCVLMIQKEVAERLTAKPPQMNRLAASVQVWAQAKILFSVSRKEFVPVPKVDSAIVVLDTKEGDAPIDMQGYEASVRALFAQPRKTILNNLASAKIYKENMSKVKIATLLARMNIRPEYRPQNLSVEDIQKISEGLKKEIAE